MADATALVMTEPGRLEEQRFPIPAIGVDDGVLRVEATGICGSDHSQFRGHLPGIGAVTPVIPGHEIVGRIEAAGPTRSRAGASPRAISWCCTRW